MDLYVKWEATALPTEPQPWPSAPDILQPWVWIPGEHIMFALLSSRSEDYFMNSNSELLLEKDK